MVGPDRAFAEKNCALLRRHQSMRATYRRRIHERDTIIRNRHDSQRVVPTTLFGRSHHGVSSRESSLCCMSGLEAIPPSLSLQTLLARR